VAVLHGAPCLQGFASQSYRRTARPRRDSHHLTKIRYLVFKRKNARGCCSRAYDWPAALTIGKHPCGTYSIRLAAKERLRSLGELFPTVKVHIGKSHWAAAGCPSHVRRDARMRTTPVLEAGRSLSGNANAYRQCAATTTASIISKNICCSESVYVRACLGAKTGRARVGCCGQQRVV
jgi:hypothetical protein